VERILKMHKIAVPEFISTTNHPELARQKKIIQYLRKIT